MACSPPPSACTRALRRASQHPTEYRSLPFIYLTREDVREYLGGTRIPLRIKHLLGKESDTEPTYENLLHALISRFGDHLIIKPEDGGSSVGVNELNGSDAQTFRSALDGVLQISDRVLIEPFMTDRLEVECSVLEDSGWVVSTPVIIDKGGTLLTYHTKYEAEESLDNPEAVIPDHVAQQIQDYCLTLAQALEVEGFARIDFFVGKSSTEIFFNEINTLPGMTDRSVFPAMTASCGYPLRDLLVMLIERQPWNR